MIKKDTIVLYPALGNGHLMSMVELGKLILTRHPSFSITILILTPPNTTNNTPISQYISSLSTRFPSFTFLHIPPILLPTTFPPHLLFGVIVNTFDALEERVVKALSEGLCVPDGPNPPVFCVGPVISGSYGGDDNGCLSWLDSQPSQSVILLSFGSLGTFTKTQLKEIAIGLEKSEQRFLWVVRCKNESNERVDSEELSLDELLPEGFLERNKEKGLVVKNWAPQAAILSHDSVGGFVTHCGWNSVLEAVCEGVPMVAWPLYAEQRMNKILMVNEMKIALGLNEMKDGFVSATELGDRVKDLMDSDKGKEIRQGIFKMKISAKEAREDGGTTSLMALDRLVKLWKQ